MFHAVISASSVCQCPGIFRKNIQCPGKIGYGFFPLSICAIALCLVSEGIASGFCGECAHSTEPLKHLESIVQVTCFDGLKLLIKELDIVLLLCAQLVFHRTVMQ